MNETELIDRAEVRDGQAIVTYSRTEAAIAELRKKYAGATYDLTTVAGDKAARAGRLELVTLRANLEKKRKELKAPALEFGKKIDSEAARLTTEIVALEKPIDDQIKADEQRRDDERRAKEAAEAARRKVHTDAIAKIAGYIEQAADLSSERIGKGITYLQGLDLSGFEEFVDEAAGTRARTIAALEVLRSKAVAREEEAARLEAQRIEQARVAEELAEQKRQLDAQRQEQERIAGEQAESKRIAEEAAALNSQIQASIKAADPDDDLAPLLGEIGKVANELSSDLIASSAIKTAQVLPLSRPAAPATAPSAPPSLTLGAIKTRIAPLQIDAAGLATLGFQPTTQGASKLYHEREFPSMLAAMVKHLEAIQAKAAA